jgi:hypothetical protein
MDKELFCFKECMDRIVELTTHYDNIPITNFRQTAVFLHIFLANGNYISITFRCGYGLHVGGLRIPLRYHELMSKFT